MIITCPSCEKKFELNANLVPDDGRTLQCGSCNHTWFFRKAEIDIIARKGDILAIVEVKTRTSVEYGKPEAFVNQKKIQMTVSASNEYIIRNDLDVEARFDIISVVKNQYKTDIEHIEEAFLSFG